MKVFLDAPYIGNSEKEKLNEVLDTGFVSTVGPCVQEFEECISEYLKIKASVSLQSGTAALHMALYELGIGPGDEVIVPVMTFAATVNPIFYTGAKPVFVDIDRETFNIDIKKIENAITPKTKAIIPVHLYGNPCDMNSIMDIAKKHSLYVIEDATESLGAKYNGIYTGTFGDFGCFSFNGNKLITTGGGGMLVSDSLKRIDHIRHLINQAKDTVNIGCHDEIGFNYRMTNIESALGLAQFSRLLDFLTKKKSFSEIYKEEFSSIDSITFQKEYATAANSYWLNAVSFPESINIDSLMIHLSSLGVQTRRLFVPLSKSPCFVCPLESEFPVAEAIYDKSLCLPSSMLNEEKEISKVARYIKDYILTNI